MFVIEAVALVSNFAYIDQYLIAGYHLINRTRHADLIYFMNPAFPSPLASTFGLSLSIKLGLWVEDPVVPVVFSVCMSLPYDAGVGCW